MSKIIIEIKDDIGDYEAIYALLDVIALGKISNSETMYCYHTEMYNGIHVSIVNKKNAKSLKFIIHLNKPKIKK